MNQNYLKKYLDIKVLRDKTVLKYWKDDKLSRTYEYKTGLDKIEKDLISEIAMSNWINGVLYTLEQISLEDRVPTFIYLATEKYGSIFEKKLREPSTYSHFYIEPNEYGKGVRVIIKKISSANINSHNEIFILPEKLKDKNKSKAYERYTKTISQFKI